MKWTGSSIGFLFCLLSCQPGNPSETSGITKPVRSDIHSHQADSLIAIGSSELKNGDIVLRTGRDLISILFSQLNTHDKRFSHCGIAFREEGDWYVYHSIGGEDNPDEKLRRDRFSTFVKPEVNSGFAVCRYPISEEESEVLQKTVLQYYREHTPFDMQFSLESDDRLYCAEMVYKAYRTATGQANFFETTYHKGFRYVSTDNLFVNNKARILCHLRY